MNGEHPLAANYYALLLTIADRKPSGKALCLLGLGLNDNGNKTPEQQEKEMREAQEAYRLRQQGLSYAEIAKRLGISCATAWRRCEYGRLERMDGESQGL